jgi:hypothetical protein
MREYIYRSRTTKDIKSKGHKNTIYSEPEIFSILKTSPYAFYSFVLYYEAGDLIKSIECLENVNEDYFKLYVNDLAPFSLIKLVQDI